LSGRKCDKPRHHPPGDVWVCYDERRSRSDLLLGLVRRGRSGKLFQGKLELQLFPHNSDVRGRFDSNPHRCRADSQNGDSNIVSDSHGLACFSRQHQHRRSLSMRWPTIAHLEDVAGFHLSSKRRDHAPPIRPFITCRVLDTVNAAGTSRFDRRRERDVRSGCSDSTRRVLKIHVQTLWFA